MLNLKNYLVAISCLLLLGSCQKESIFENHSCDHTDGEKIEFNQEMGMDADLSALNFTVENGILSFPTQEDATNYSFNVSLLSLQERVAFEKNIGFTSLSTIGRDFYQQLSETSNSSDVSGLLDEGADFVTLEDGGITLKFIPFSLVQNKDHLVKIEDTYYSFTAEKALFSNNLEVLIKKLVDPNFTDISLHTSLPVKSAETRSDAVNGNCFGLANQINRTHIYPHAIAGGGGGDGSPTKRLKMDASIYSFPIGNGTYYIAIDYIATNDVLLLVHPSGLKWGPQRCGMLGEMKMTNTAFSFSESDYTSIIEFHAVFIESQPYNLSDFDWVMASCWNPAWHRVGCRI